MEALPLPLRELPLLLVQTPLPLLLLPPLVHGKVLWERVAPYLSRCGRGVLIQRPPAAALREEKRPERVLPLLPSTSRRAASLPGRLLPFENLLLLVAQAWPDYDLCGNACLAWGLLPLVLVLDCCSFCFLRCLLF